MEALPKIKAKELKKAKKDAWDFLEYVVFKYFEMTDNNSEIMREFNNSQHTLLAYYYLDGQVCNGGFIRLIQNGYGGYIFDNPFSETIKLWGLEETANIVEEAKIIYNNNKNKWETQTSLEEFSALYKEINAFEPLEDRFYEIKKQDAEKIKKYVEENIHEFVIIL